MHKIKNTIRLCLMYVSMVVLASGYPMAAFAETTDGTIAPEAAPEAPAAPPAPERVYNYNPDTRRWDSDKWVFNPSTGRYEAAPQPVVVAPAPVTPDSTPQSTTTT